jgi:hypothetical protein
MPAVNGLFCCSNNDPMFCAALPLHLHVACGNNFGRELLEDPLTVPCSLSSECRPSAVLTLGATPIVELILSSQAVPETPKHAFADLSGPQPLHECLA